MVGITHWYMKLHIVLIQKRNIVLFIYCTPCPRFFVQIFSLSIEIDLFSLELSGFFIILSPSIATDEDEYRRAVWVCGLGLHLKSARAGLSHTSFKVTRISSLLAQIEQVKLIMIKLRGNGHFLEGTTIEVWFHD